MWQNLVLRNFQTAVPLMTLVSSHARGTHLPVARCKQRDLGKCFQPFFYHPLASPMSESQIR